MATLKKFRNLEELNQYLTNETEVALQETLRAMIPKLRYFIDKDVYYAYHPTFYKRTRWLKRRNDVIEQYISNLQHKLRGGIRIVDTIFDSVSDREKFQHGSAYRTKAGQLHTYSELSGEQFLEILTEGERGINPFGFPSIKRENFWEEFLEWAKKEQPKIFERKCKNHKIDLTNIGSSDNVVLNKPQPKEPSPAPPATSVTDTPLERKEQGWHSIGNNRLSNKGIDLHMKIFGIGSGKSALGQTMNSSKMKLSDLYSTEIKEDSF